MYILFCNLKKYKYLHSYKYIYDIYKHLATITSAFEIHIKKAVSREWKHFTH